jgi:hydrogenase assembly chaperone HypC/HupF
VRRTTIVPRCAPEDGCITCSDEGLPLRVRELDEATGLAVCEDEDGYDADVDVSLVAPVAVGDMVLVHAGVALTRLEAEK